MKFTILIAAFAASIPLPAQEAASGFDLRATLSVAAIASTELRENPRAGAPVDAGFRAVFYPTWKLSDHWTVTGTFQVLSRPWLFESFSTQGHGAKGQLLQGTLNYSRVGVGGSVSLRAGMLTTAFGSFPLRYDDADNPLIDTPLQYGYYDPVSIDGLAGVQLDVTRGKWDGRVQMVNSSPVNARSVFAKDQYANFAGGLGYSIRQGFRVGVSGYRGPYLDRHYRYFFPGEANPVDLPASALGVEADWAQGHWYAHGELQKFVLRYRVVPTFYEHGGYGELKRVLSPRWYVAARAGYLHPSFGNGRQSVEAAVGFRPGRDQLLKLGYETQRYGDDEGMAKTVTLQYVATIHPFSFSRN